MPTKPKARNAPENPKARNNAAHASLQSYFDRISHSLEDRISEYVHMRKYIRVYEESNQLLEIEKTINIAAGSIFEINVDNKLDLDGIKRLMLLLSEQNKTIRSFVQGKSQSLQLKLLIQISKNIILVINNLSKINKHIARVNEIIPVIKALLKLPDREGNYEDDPILVEISNALTISIDEPNLTNIKTILAKNSLTQHYAKFNFEDMNDVSDKIVGLLNDKLLLVIGISEFLIAGVEDDGANDVAAQYRLSDELRVLFLASSTLEIIHRTQEIRISLKTILNSIKLFKKIISSDRLEDKYKALLKNGDNNVNELISNMTPNILQRLKKAILEVAPGLDALNLKLKMDTIDLETVIQITYGLIYEKANKIWENPYRMYKRQG